VLAIDRSGKGEEAQDDPMGKVLINPVKLVPLHPQIEFAGQFCRAAVTAGVTAEVSAARAGADRPSPVTDAAAAMVSSAVLLFTMVLLS
jgi:hypothetical protein